MKAIKIKPTLAIWFFSQMILQISMSVAWAEPALINNPSADVTAPDHESNKSSNKLIVDYEHDVLNQGFSPWDLSSISIGHHFAEGSLIARYNKARRFDDDGELWEVDAYPRIREGTYAYLNYGHSNSSIFPKNRYGGEIFQMLPQSFEGSLGIRNLEFAGGTVVLWTGSLAKYLGNYYIYFRTYYTPSDIGTSTSGTLGLRYYLDDEQYLAVAVGKGLSVQENSSLETVGLNSSKASIDAYLSLGSDMFIHPSIGFDKSEVRSTVYREIWSYEISLEKRF